MKNSAPFRRWLEAMMDARGWSRSDLARQSGISQPNVTRILNRDTLEIRDETAEALAKLFKISYLDLHHIAAGELSLEDRTRKSDTVDRLQELEAWLRRNPEHIKGLEDLLRNYGYNPGLGSDAEG